ncbi:hypothetical protein CFBP6411_03338 [Pseudomonas syringae group genomosp. 3]|uniref:Uncharacterized protein n=1 Tax=Pseudomonas syringae group genomosp. 3 TaxID=251701 RepID=A0A2K4WFM9_9PSED|nr:hypothetical protein [Pseudomonas syringae group genomosp. 3]SOS34695.1 hypothetical protein CFBP6411_03338 [Pseudomonas syringae group genomosp. 3]
MPFSVSGIVIAEDGRLLVTLQKKATGTNTQIWVTPPTAIGDLTIKQIEDLAKQEAAKEHAC